LFTSHVVYYHGWGCCEKQMKTYLRLRVQTIIGAFVFTLATLSCGVQAAIPTSEPAPNVMVQLPKPTRQPTATEASTTTVKTLGTVNVRVCPSTSCEAIDQTQEGQILTVGEKITNECPDCNNWYPVQWVKKDGSKVGAWICADWMTR